MISIKGLDKAEVLKALYDNSNTQGLGYLQEVDSFTIEDARELLKVETYFDYINGRVMKIDLSSDKFEETLYDRDNWEGLAFSVIEDLKIHTKEKYMKSIEILEWEKHELLSVPDHVKNLVDHGCTNYTYKERLDTIDLSIFLIKKLIEEVDYYEDN